ncbi:metallophosphoesterase [Pectobacteriaceae bacterium CE90]|nr:metallophosphoesterase [Pectobacteriaceae bacterium CE90]
MDIYQRIDGSAWSHIYVVGDLHGCYQLLLSKLDDVGFDTGQDLLISVGDLIDRGPQSVECLELINQKWFRAVRGNHEQMAIDSLHDDGNITNWVYNGGGWYFRLEHNQALLVNALLVNAAKLPYVIEVNAGGSVTVIAHADYPSDVYAFEQSIDLKQVLWNRKRISNAMNKIGAPITGADLFIFGHTPTNKPETFWNQYYIDTGAFFSKKLTLIQLQ